VLGSLSLTGELRAGPLGQENTSLTTELLEQLPGILNWTLAGLQQLEAKGRFTEPESSKDVMIALQDLVSPVSAFVRDRCERNGEVGVKRLYEAWKLWAEDHGHRHGSAATFGRDLRAAVPGVKKTRPREGEARDAYYVGISLLHGISAVTTRDHRDGTTDAGDSDSDQTCDQRRLVTDGHGDQAMYSPGDRCDLCGEVPCADWCGAGRW
jgi:putative DNA primase/helicase